MPDTDAVLFANEAFYRAFAKGDAHAMEQVWSERNDVACLHPGWGPLFGRADVLTSWKAIMAASAPPGIECFDARAQIHGDMAVVICFEQLGGSRLVATNLFAREGSVWKMVLHQAGPTAGGPASEAPLGAVH